MATSDVTEEGKRRDKMQFLLKSGNRCGPRMGTLLWTTPTGSSASPLETPLCMLYSRGGAVPNLTRDLEEEVVGHRRTGCHITGSETPVMLTMPTMLMNGYQVKSVDVLNKYKGHIHNFLKRESQLLYLSALDPGTPTSYKFNEEKSVAVWTRHGRSKVGVADHVSLLRAFQPNMFECLFDFAPSRENKMKRINKSVDRTLKFLDETVASFEAHQDELGACSLLGAIVGSDVIAERVRSARETAARPVDGFVVEGFDTEKSECLQEILVGVNQCLPEGKPRFVHGLHTPEDILEAVACGVDVFETSYAYRAAEKGCAVVFPRGQRSNGSVDGVVELKCDDPCQFEMDLSEDRFAADFAPFLPGCSCYACRHHTRAYTHHLIVTNEILARILLMMHNLSHYLEFFAGLRNALRSSSFKNFKQSCLHKQ